MYNLTQVYTKAPNVDSHPSHTQLPDESANLYQLSLASSNMEASKAGTE